MAAADGHSGALFHPGVSYETERGIEQNLQLAAHFYRLAAARYHVATQYNLAVMHANGKGAERNLEKALGLILIAKQRSGAHPKKVAARCVPSQHRRHFERQPNSPCQMAS